MSEPIRPVESLLDHAVAEWLLAHDRGLTPEEAGRFEAWLAQSPANPVAWERASVLWDSFDRETDPVIDNLLATARATRTSLWSSAPLRFAALAASLVLALGLGLLTFSHTRSLGEPDQNVARAGGPFQVLAASNRPASFRLADGSSVVVDARSEVQVRQTSARREVILANGQAFFDVAHDARRPFVVAVGSNQVTDIGTAFSVSTGPKGLSVILQRGRVRITRHGATQSPVDLSPGQQYAERDGRIDVAPVDVEAALAWRDGRLELHDTPVAEAVEQINRYGGPPLTVGDAKAGALKITGQYQLDDPAGFADSVAAIYPARVQRLPNGGLEIVSRPGEGRR